MIGGVCYDFVVISLKYFIEARSRLLQTRETSKAWTTEEERKSKVGDLAHGRVRPEEVVQPETAQQGSVPQQPVKGQSQGSSDGERVLNSLSP